jgi:hypothetical protein
MMGEWGPVTSRTIDLGHEQLLMLEGRAGTRVKVIYGGVWLTEEGEPHDVFALSGDEVALRTRRRSVLEGLGATRVELIEPVAADGIGGLVRRFGETFRRLARTARRLPAPAWTPLVPRGTLAALAAVVGVAIPALVTVGIAATAPTLAQFI